MTEWSESAIQRGIDGLHTYDCWDEEHRECRQIVKAVLGLPVAVRSAAEAADS